MNGITPVHVRTTRTPARAGTTRIATAVFPAALSQRFEKRRGGCSGLAGQPPPMMKVLFVDCFSVRRRPMCWTIGSISRGRGSVTFTWSPSGR